jgi:hypothetical protein
LREIEVVSALHHGGLPNPVSLRWLRAHQNLCPWRRWQGTGLKCRQQTLIGPCFFC